MSASGTSSRLPRFAADWAEGFAAEVFGLAARAEPIGGYEDQNFVLTAAAGERFVLKLSGAELDPAAVELQHRAMRHLGAADPELGCPTPQRAADGREIFAGEIEGVPFKARLLTYVEGTPLRELESPPPRLLRQLGAVAGATARRLGELDGSEGLAAGEWDLREAGRMLATAIPQLADPARRELAERAARAAEAALEPLAPRLREGLIHADLTDENVIVERQAGGVARIAGVIDFGDLCRSWVVAELAVVAASCLGRWPRVETLVELARGFHQAAPLGEAEVDALLPLLALRAVAGAVQTDLRAAAEPENAHLEAAVPWEWRTLELVAGLPAIAGPAVRAACGMAPSPAGAALERQLREHPAEPATALVDGLGPSTPVLDLSVRTELLELGEWRDPGAVAARIAARAAGGLALGRYGEARLVGDSGPAAEEPATVHLGVDVFAPPGTKVRAPFAARVRGDGDRGLVLEREGHRLHLRGLAPVAAGGEAVAGDTLGSVAPPLAADLLPAHVHVQLCCEPFEQPPGLVPASLAAAWRGACPDPGPLLGVAAAAPEERPELVLRDRLRFVASPQFHYYEEPPEIVRGWRQWLYDSGGRAHLDVVNNVAVLGHSHPAVTAAAARQFKLLNTNSRFLYRSMNRFAEALVEVVPDPLDVVFLVSSGSEANDLALQLIRRATGSEEVISLRGAYHGWTGNPFELSTHLQSNPDGRLGAGARPVPSPFAADGPGAGAADVRRAIEELRAEGGGLAGFISEAFSGVSGGVALPDGYLREVYAMVREAGGLTIADEVQAGYGRLGAHFWAFEQQGVVPDVVSIAKSTGNGHPVAAVITRREIADAYAARAPWFSSVGGGPVSAEVGLAVLRALKEEGLQQNALEVGGYLRAELERLAERHQICAGVQGMGLYLGLELRDPASGEPAVAAAFAICERMLRLGVIVQPTGDHDNVLKIKPPLVVDRADADLLVERLDQALRMEWF